MSDDHMRASVPEAVAAVLGWPVAHSLSPRLHGFWLQEEGLAGTYLGLPVAPESFEVAVRGLAAAGFRGVNVTVPHKLAALRLADEVDDAARAIGAVNTLVFQPDGRILGRNTDAYGFMANLRQAGVDPKVGPALVIGAGGAARAAVHALLVAGCPRIYLTNRTEATGYALAESMADDRIVLLPFNCLKKLPDDIVLLGNTTSLGMAGKGALDVDLSGLPETAWVHDIVYVPLETPLLQAARQRGLRTVDGLGMLLHQAVPAFRAFFGRDVTVTDSLRAHVLGGK
ncbi:MAG: shikimate dehydrogenase (NADP(+)) [Minwuia thermotolerans]|nr:MAG: shikimate dehydrogenase (NADP(+)) [Minwuia thermotolerans]